MPDASLVCDAAEPSSFPDAVRQSGRQPAGTLMLIAALTLAALDAVLTLKGQSRHYWDGYFELADETNPIGHAALARGPALFALTMCGWAGILCALARSRRRGVALVALVAAAAGHCNGAATWLLPRQEWGVPLVLAIAIASAGLIAIGAIDANSIRSSTACSTITTTLVVTLLATAVCAILSPLEPAPLDDAANAAGRECELGREASAEQILLSERIRTLEAPVCAPERFNAELNLGLFYERTNRPGAARQYVSEALQDSSMCPLSPAMLAFAHDLLARVTAS